MIKRIVTILMAIVLCTSQVWAATYCLHNNGTAGSKTVATDCLTVGNCMDEGVYNGETFSASDIILICPHGGDFDEFIDFDTTVGVTYTGVYDSVYGWPIFSVGATLSGSNNTLAGIEYQPGVAESGTQTFEGVRIADTSRSWEAAEETPVTDWTKTDKFIVGAGIGMTGGGAAVTPEIRWRDKTDAGSWTALAASGELKYGDCTALTDEANLTTGNFGTSSGKTKVEGVKGEQENSAVAGGATTLTAEQYTELQACFDPASADYEHEYAFALFESATQVGGESSATLTIEADTSACASAGCTGTYKLCWTGDYSGDTDKGCINSGATTKDGTVTGLTINATYGQSGNGALASTTGDRILYTRTGSAEIDTDEGTMKCTIKVPASLTTANYVAGTNYGPYSRIVFSVDSDRTVTGWHVGDSTHIVRVASNATYSDNCGTITVPASIWTNVYFAWSKSSNQIAVKIGANSWCNDKDADSVASLQNAPTTVGFGDVGSIGLVDYYYMDNCKVSGTYKDESL